MPPKSLKDQLREQKKDAIFGFSRDLPKIIEVRVANLRPNSDQPRKVFDEERLQELANSIARHGLLQPIVVKPDPEKPGGFIVVAGERRFRAHQRLGRESVAAIMTDGNADELALIENLQREDLHPVEEAEALHKIKTRHGYTDEELAKVVGKSRSTVTELLSINKLPEDIRDEARKVKEVNKSQLVQLGRLDSEVEQQRLWQGIKTGGVKVSHLRGQKGSKPAPPLLERIVREGQTLTEHLAKVQRDEVQLTEDQRTELQALADALNRLLEDTRQG